MTQWDEESVAAELFACEAERRDREPFTDEWPGLGLDLSRVWRGWPLVDGAQDFDHGFLFGE